MRSHGRGLKSNSYELPKMIPPINLWQDCYNRYFVWLYSLSCLMNLPPRRSFVPLTYLVEHAYSAYQLIWRVQANKKWKCGLLKSCAVLIHLASKLEAYAQMFVWELTITHNAIIFDIPWAIDFLLDKFGLLQLVHQGGQEVQLALKVARHQEMKWKAGLSQLGCGCSISWCGKQVKPTNSLCLM